MLSITSPHTPRLIAVNREVVPANLEVRKSQIAGLEPLHAQTDRQPTRGEVHREIQIPAALHQPIVKKIARRASPGRPLEAWRRPPSFASLTAS